MKNIMTILLVFYLLPVCAQSDYGPVEAHNDSMRIYEAYEKEYGEIGTLRETDIASWRERQAANDSITACAKMRLQKYNGKPYGTMITLDRPGFGEAYRYQNPNWDEDYETGNKKKYFCTVYDEQTRFMKDSAGRMTPYILKIEFTNNSLPLKTKLDPVTYAVLKQ